MATSRLRRKLERDGAPSHVNYGESFVKVWRKIDTVWHTLASSE